VASAEFALMVRVVRINVAPVKGLGLQHPQTVELGRHGVDENRRFYLTHEGRMFNGKRFGPLVQVLPEARNGSLTLRFPDGREVAGDLELGEAVTTDFWGRPVTGRVVEGPWSEALSSFAGDELRLVCADAPESGVDVYPGTLVSLASGERLAEELGAAVDLRRFRMLLEVDGLAAHAEDAWDGRDVQIGDAIVRMGGPVPRCVVTTHDPDTGVRSLDTLRALTHYRGLRDGEAIDFGVYFDVVEPGRVAVGDPVEPL
jgi:hypothetical protein